MDHKKGSYRLSWENVEIRKKRFLKSTFAICPKDPLIDLGPLVIDLWLRLNYLEKSFKIRKNKIDIQEWKN